MDGFSYPPPARRQQKEPGRGESLHIFSRCSQKSFGNGRKKTGVPRTAMMAVLELGDPGFETVRATATLKTGLILFSKRNEKKMKRKKERKDMDRGFE